IMVADGSPTVAELGAAGVARISLGSSVAQAAYEVARRAATELVEQGTYAAVRDRADYAWLNDLMGAAR
ncbi:MAG: isocitrate lyase/phosphoenolpyruvate mutase family protein, partial [Demequina sp.]